MVSDGEEEVGLSDGGGWVVSREDTALNSFDVDDEVLVGEGLLQGIGARVNGTDGQSPNGEKVDGVMGMTVVESHHVMVEVGETCLEVGRFGKGVGGSVAADSVGEVDGGEVGKVGSGDVGSAEDLAAGSNEGFGTLILLVAGVLADDEEGG